ncbi:MAG: glycosyltransferase family 4 protein [Thermoguttaceae bacterium]
MRILILSQFFDPEPDFKGLPFARELVRRGHEVEVLTGFPNYPGGKLYPGYRVRPWRREMMDGVAVNRVPLYPSHDRSSVRRMANYVSFALSASTIGPWLVKKPDVIYAYHPPVTVGLPALVLRTLNRCPVVYDIQDLWPDTVASSQMLGSRRLIAAIDRWCRFVYRRMDRIVVLSPGFRETLISRGVDPAKIDVIYNWADEASLRRSDAATASGEQTSALQKLAGRFNVVFAGTMGLVQSLDTALDAARICATATPDAQFVFVGSGVDRARLERRAAEMQLSNVLFLPRQPVETIGAILAMADAALVHLKDDPLFRITIPSKIQAYFALGRPILAAVAGDAAELVARSGGGVACPPQNAAAMAAAVARLRAMSRQEREAMAARGRAFYDEQLSLAVGVERFEQAFRAAAGQCRSGRGKDTNSNRLAVDGTSALQCHETAVPVAAKQDERRAA